MSVTPTAAARQCYQKKPTNKAAGRVHTRQIFAGESFVPGLRHFPRSVGESISNNGSGRRTWCVPGVPHGTTLAACRLHFSILQAKVRCPNCGWVGTVDRCEPDIDGDGSLGCPACSAVVIDETQPGFTDAVAAFSKARTHTSSRLLARISAKKFQQQNSRVVVQKWQERPRQLGTGRPHKPVMQVRLLPTLDPQCSRPCAETSCAHEPTRKSQGRERSL